MKKCKILFKVEINKEKYVIYTNEEKNEYGDIIAYAASCDDNGLNPIEDEELLEYLGTILLQIQKNIKNGKKESEIYE